MKPAYRTLPRDVVTVAEAAAILGISSQAIYAGLRCGRVSFTRVQGRKVLQRDGLEERWWGSSQRVADHPQPRAAEAGPDWQRIATRLNRYLGGGRWPAPPYSGEQAATVAMCLSLALEAVADG